MSIDTTPYLVGDLIRKKIKEMRITNGYVIAAMVDAGIEMSDSKFSNKIYGMRDRFNDDELKKISKILKTEFTN